MSHTPAPGKAKLTGKAWQQTYGGGVGAVPSSNFTYQSTIMYDDPDNQKSAPIESTTQALQLQVDALKKKVKELETWATVNADQIKDLQEAFAELWKKSSGQGVR